MGAKAWLLVYAAGEVAPILRSRPRIDRDATRALVARLYPGRSLAEIADGTVADNANPIEDQVYAGCFAELTVVCTDDAALDQPSRLDPRFHAEAHGRTLYLIAMHSVVDWFAYAIWDRDGQLRRALSLSPDSGVVENVGDPLPFEAAYWAGQYPVEPTGKKAYPLPFHPLDLAEEAMEALVGFSFEGMYDDDPFPEDVALAGFMLEPAPQKRRFWHRRR